MPPTKEVVVLQEVDVLVEVERFRRRRKLFRREVQSFLSTIWKLFSSLAFDLFALAGYQIFTHVAHNCFLPISA
jgi:hypothetical protein